MKKLLTVLIAAAVALTAYPAFAAILGSPHDFGGQANSAGYVYGTCDACHVPHAAKEKKRLWNNTTVTTITGLTGDWSGTPVGVGMLCASCHVSTYFTATNKAEKLAHPMLSYAYAATSHGNSLATLANKLENTGGTAPTFPIPGKPYTNTNTGTMECTSCHNPHQDGGPGGVAGSSGIRPFLRANSGDTTISSFCAECHTTRYQSAVDTANNPDGDVTAGVFNTDNHPSDYAYGDVAANGVGWFKSLVAGANGNALLTYVYGANGALEGWSLGGKMQASNGSIPTSSYSVSAGTSTDANGVAGGTTQNTSYQIGCMTCHSIHAPGNTATIGGAPGWLLAVNNDGTDGKSGLCETCHGQAITGTWATRAGGVATSANAGMDHPIDGTIGTTYINTFITTWSGTGATFTTSPRMTVDRSNIVWPRSVMSGGGAGIMCTSCHSAHHAGNRLRRANGDTTDWCKSCHPSVSPLGHHSHMDNDVKSTVKCSDCHYDAPTGVAHNGFVYYNLGGDNMGSGALDENTNRSANPNVPLTRLGGGQGCAECHFSTTNNVASPEDYVPPVNRLGEVVTNKTQISHFLGQFDTNGKVSINVKTGAWNNVPMLPNHKGEDRDYSKYGNTTGIGSNNGVYILSCESCHSILGNIGREVAFASISSGWENNLLLQDYEDDSYYGNGAASDPTASSAAAGTSSGNGITWATQSHAQGVGSEFCVGCHNQGTASATADGAGGTANGPVSVNAITDPTVAPQNMHPMTGWTITKAQDAGRTTGNGIRLTTDQSAGSYADNTQVATIGTSGGSVGLGAGEGAVSYPASGKMDCDSCHKPHNAPSNAYLDVSHIKTRTLSGSAIGNGLVQTPVGDNTLGVPVILEYASTSGTEDTGTLCMQCHNY
ncbi:MAG: hypothetical protein ACYDFU_02295 [Nitrospirota bacterium]